MVIWRETAKDGSERGPRSGPVRIEGKLHPLTKRRRQKEKEWMRKYEHFSKKNLTIWIGMASFGRS
ncbi:hypothetical protein LEP1GSC195_0948 [Leptospira wolbachii serovar Codice str. CDC]|uniref:Uncharacterized protein n=1 Tax=Leptospira wolbachii serovar Codice str. CDC TaxID=1218599 RepID=R9A7J8_9LEPT|nr:hypothetical protein LEP1GSC195_0948 [Leptospira wolbachii serovar Codice str. CDC]